MKSFKIICLLLLSLTLMMSCSSNDDEIVTETPQEIEAFVKMHFDNNAILKITKEMSGNSHTYDVNLAGNIELEFNSKKEITSIESATKIPDSVIPANIRSYVTTNYPSNFIIGWELEATHQQVELNNSVELEFTMSGEFIRIDV